MIFDFLSLNIIPISDGANIILATNDNPIIIAQNNPNVEKNPILDCVITRNPPISDNAEPKSASPEAPPTIPIDVIVSCPFSRRRRKRNR